MSSSSTQYSDELGWKAAFHTHQYPGHCPQHSSRQGTQSLCLSWQKHVSFTWSRLSHSDKGCFYTTKIKLRISPEESCYKTKSVWYCHYYFLIKPIKNISIINWLFFASQKWTFCINPKVVIFYVWSPTWLAPIQYFTAVTLLQFGIWTSNLNKPRI